MELVKMSRDSSVGIVMGYGPEGQGIFLSFQPGPGAHPSSCPVSIEGPLLGGQRGAA
jgi:hypothetical protein